MHNAGLRGIVAKGDTEMLRNLWQSLFSAFVVLAVFAVLLAVLAIVVYGALAVYVNDRNSGLFKYIFFGFVILMVTGGVPCIVIRQLKIRSAAVYLIAGILSGIFAEYCWLWVFAIYDNLWSWVHVVTASDGSGYDRTPPLLDVLGAAYRYAPSIIVHDIVRLWQGSVLYASIGALCSGLFWLAFIWWPAKRQHKQ